MAADPAVLAEIARLSGLVNRQKYGLPPYDGSIAGYGPAFHRPHRGRGRGGGHHRGGAGAAAARGRGRGRGAARHLTNNVWTPSSSPSTPAVAAATAAASTSTSQSQPQPAHKSVHRKLVLNNNNSSGTSTTNGTVSAANNTVGGSSSSAAPSIPSTSSKPDEPEEGEIEQTVEERKNAKINPGREVVINGITFIADAKGKKLVRKSCMLIHPPGDASALASRAHVGLQRLIDFVPLALCPASLQASATTAADGATASTSTPSKTSIDGQSYVRTKSGNLISSDLVKKREMEAKKKRLDHLVGVIKGVQKARGQGRSNTANKKLEQQRKTLCRFFQKTGVCTRGLTCPYLHDSSKVSICPRYIRNSCPLPSSKCPLSHVPDPHRMPHCLHFPYCTRGEACLYSHVHVSPTAKVCKDFVLLGWCEKGLECKERHVWECPEFSEKGTCKRKGCKLPHVIRKGAAAEGEDDASLFVKDVVGTLKAAAAASAEGQGDIGHSLPNPDDKGKKRALEENDEEGGADSSADEVEGELLNNHKKKQKLGFNPDAVEANEDYVTLLISDTEASGAEEDEEGEDDSEEDSSVEDSEEEEEHTNEADVKQTEQTGISHVFTSSTAKDRFSRRAERDDDDDDDDDSLQED